MKTLILAIACFFSLNLISQKSEVETDSLSLYFSFPCIAFDGEYGIEYDGDDIYVTSSISDSIAKYDIDGTLLEKFVIPEVANVRDMAYDGEFCYGGTNDYFFYVMDMTTKTLLIKFDLPVRVHSIAFNKEENTFWINEEGSHVIYEVDLYYGKRDSIVIESADSIYITGLAYGPRYSWPPYLWIFCQDGTRSLLLKYNIDTKEQVGYEIDLSSLVSGSALSGGLFLERKDYTYSFIIGGIIQDQLIFALDLDYANQLVNTGEKVMITEFDIYPNPATNMISISTSLRENQDANCRIYNQAGQIMYNKKLSSNKMKINLKKFPVGAYFVQLTGIEGFSFTKKFLKVN
ncbi:MAG: T9SS type A sorting domain-containing protein [Bacteroidetes bacterium]|nr:T9SS type A sorting domain-containing protein [Bacteroidota bacterium]